MSAQTTQQWYYATQLQDRQSETTVEVVFVSKISPVYIVKLHKVSLDSPTPELTTEWRKSCEETLLEGASKRFISNKQVN